MGKNQKNDSSKGEKYFSYLNMLSLFDIDAVLSLLCLVASFLASICVVEAVVVLLFRVEFVLFRVGNALSILVMKETCSFIGFSDILSSLKPVSMVVLFIDNFCIT